MKNVLKISISLLNVCIGFVLAFLFVTLLTSRSAILASVRSYVVKTGSMVPAISIGTLVFTHPQEQYVVGDVITFHRGDVTVTHRVAGVSTGDQASVYTTKGDANEAADSDLVPAGAVIGKVILMLPYLGIVTDFVKTIPGFIVTIIIPALCIIGSEFLVIKKELEAEVRKRMSREALVHE